MSHPTHGNFRMAMTVMMVVMIFLIVFILGMAHLTVMTLVVNCEVYLVGRPTTVLMFVLSLYVCPTVSHLQVCLVFNDVTAPTIQLKMKPMAWRTSDARIAALAEPADKDVPSISRIHLLCFQNNFFHPLWASCSLTIPSPPSAHMTDIHYLPAPCPTTFRVSYPSIFLPTPLVI